jgi:predicted kinase
MISALAARANGSRSAASTGACFDGVNRDYFFPRMKSDAPSGMKVPGGALLHWSIAEEITRSQMEAVVFVGIPGSGKSTFFKERFFSTHVRISLDLLKTRHRELLFLDACLGTEQRFVIDNTNPTAEERMRYVVAAKEARYSVVGYYFQSKVEECLRRNAERSEAERVPEVAILSSAKKLKLPAWEEGFDQLYYVRLEDRRFVVEEWRDEV